ncbi:hypothetical protein [Ruegeria atlantica]|nr:hypothetical protein [Ruegeria atlantica]
MQEQNSETKAAEALEALEQAWAYYTPVPAPVFETDEPKLFEYANAA